MTSREIAEGVQDRTVGDYKAAWGPGIEREPSAAGWVLILCLLGSASALFIGYVLAVVQ